MGSKDSLFRLSTTLKHGGSWDVLAIVLQLKSLTFERFDSRFALLVVNKNTELFMVVHLNNHSMAFLKEKRQKLC